MRPTREGIAEHVAKRGRLANHTAWPPSRAKIGLVLAPSRQKYHQTRDWMRSVSYSLERSLKWTF